MTHDHQLAQSIDHTLLKPTATSWDYKKLCREAQEHSFFSVCVPPYWVPFCRSLLNDSPVKICTVIGFPLGYSSTPSKVFETQEAIRNGADEIDMVMNVSALKSGFLPDVHQDIFLVKKTCQEKILKVILETGCLTDAEIIRACQISEAAGADFVKTSTGFGAGGATESHVRLMRSSVSKKIHVKASGGIRDLTSARKFLDLGASRLGTSAGVSILEGTLGKGGY